MENSFSSALVPPPGTREGWSSHRCAVALFADAHRVGRRLDLLQGADEPRRVAGEERALGVGQVLAVARDGELDDLAGDRREDQQHEPDREDDELEPAAVRRRCPAARRTRPTTTTA